MIPTAYDYSNKDLVEALSRAVRAAVLEEGVLTPSLRATYLRELESYLKGVLLARLEGRELPMRQGDLVQLCAVQDAVTPLYTREGSGPENLDPATRYTIKKILYVGEGRWTILLRSKTCDGCYYDARHFSKVEEAEADAQAAA